MFVDQTTVRRSGITRWRALVIIVLAMCLVGPTVALSQQVPRPRDGNYPDTLDYDLATITLRPGDYGIDDMRSVETILMGPASFVDDLAGELDADPDDIADEFDDAGFHAVYVSRSAVFTDREPSEFRIGAQSLALEFEDEEGAETGFGLLEQGQSGEEIDTAPGVGDESIMFREEMETDGQDAVVVDYLLRVENIIGVIELLWVGDAMEEELDPDEFGELAAAMEDRIESALDGDTPGHVMKMLRLDGTDELSIQSHFEYLDVVDGEYIDVLGETEEFSGPVREFWEDAGVEQIYRIATSFVPEDEPDDPGAMYLSRIYEFASRRDARSFIDAGPEYFLTADVEGGYFDIEPVDDLPEFDGEAAVLAYAYDVAGPDPSTGYRVWVRVDNYVVSMEADSIDGTDLDVLYALLDQQLACVQDDSYCRPMEVPTDLFG